MAKLALIGCSPSSGSTMFADLLDSSEHSACGPELEFFCNRNLFEFKRFKASPRTQSELFSIGSTGIFPRFERLKHYGLAESELMKMVSASDSLNAFQRHFAAHFASYREKGDDSIVFEKTPQNANSIDLWLNSSNENHFVFLYRDPFYVFNSLMNRGWSLYTSVVTWLSYLGKVLPHFDNPRLHGIKLENLVEDPFGITSELINNIHGSLDISPEQVRLGYENNSYRKQSSKRKAEWEVNTVTSGIMNPNAKVIAETRLALFKVIGKQKLGLSYAERFALEVIPLRDACLMLGYDVDRFSESSDLELAPSTKERIKFFTKTVRSVVTRTGNLGDSSLFLNALD